MAAPIDKLLRRPGRAPVRSGWRDLLRHLTGGADPSGRSAFSPTGTEIVRRPPRGKVLVLAPHPDDEIIGPGGTLAAHRDNGDPVTVVYLTDGGGPPDAADRAGLIATRRREAEAIGRLLGFEQIFWTHPDTRLSPAAAASDLAALLETVGPDRIYLPSFFEHHYDHYAANALLASVLDAADVSVAGFEVWDALPIVNRVVDIGATLERKVEAMELYATPLAYTDFVRLIRCRATLHHLLHVDSRRAETGGAAEAFLDLTAQEFRESFRRWDERLRAAGSPLATRLETP